MDQIYFDVDKKKDKSVHGTKLTPVVQEQIWHPHIFWRDSVRNKLIIYL